MHSVPIYQVQQIRDCERLAVERFNVAEDILMQRAGKAAFDFLLHRFPWAKKIAVFCGSGNNGGDGYVLAKFAHEHGLNVTVWQVGTQTRMKKLAQAALLVCQKAKLVIRTFDEKADLDQPDVMVDAICGIGAHGVLREDIVFAIEKMQRIEAPIFSIDAPSGIDIDTGQVLRFGRTGHGHNDIYRFKVRFIDRSWRCAYRGISLK